MNYWLWLASIDGIGSIKKQKLLEEFQNTPEKIFKATEKELLQVEGIGEKLSKKIFLSKDAELIYRMEKYMKVNKIEQLNIYDEKYPENLKNIYDPPITLFYKGNIDLLKTRCVSVVGSRNATKYGLDTSYKIGKDCAISNFTVVSGMARGVDTMAHKGTLKQNGNTIAVVGCGLDKVYPPENISLFKEIESTGLIISEFVVGSQILPGNFPARNRIISGVSDDLIIVEATEKSGALITVDYALEQGKNVYVVPGNIDSYKSKGTNELIKNGAFVYTSIKDIV